MSKIHRILLSKVVAHSWQYISKETDDAVAKRSSSHAQANLLWYRCAHKKFRMGSARVSTGVCLHFFNKNWFWVGVWTIRNLADGLDTWKQSFKTRGIVRLTCDRTVVSVHESITDETFRWVSREIIWANLFKCYNFVYLIEVDIVNREDGGDESSHEKSHN